MGILLDFLHSPHHHLCELVRWCKVGPRCANNSFACSCAVADGRSCVCFYASLCNAALGVLNALYTETEASNARFVRVNHSCFPDNPLSFCNGRAYVYGFLHHAQSFSVL